MNRFFRFALALFAPALVERAHAVQESREPPLSLPKDVPEPAYRRGSGYSGGKVRASKRIAEHCKAMCFEWLNTKHSGYRKSEASRGPI